MLLLAGTPPRAVTAWVSVTKVPVGVVLTPSSATAAPGGMPMPETDIPGMIAAVGANSRTVQPAAVGAIVTRINGADGLDALTGKNVCTRRMNAAIRAAVFPVPGGSQVGWSWKNLAHCC